MQASCFLSPEWAFRCNPETSGSLNERSRKRAVLYNFYSAAAVKIKILLVVDNAAKGHIVYL